ncbi:BatD family protein [Luteibacter sp.]|uniref:BatD family protein n=1 Tax=Luteibacter sp. TaxID=1886636 RepID=UPI0025C1EAC5|nr:BatD family protein [Luteibacter sp.]
MRGVRYLTLLALWPMLALAQATAPTASLDRSKVGLGETVTLNIEVGDEDAGSPDLSPLMTDFVVLGTSTNHSLSIVNGRREAHTILGVALRPRHEGHLTVPALTIGAQKTQPLDLDVQAGSQGGAASADRPVVLEGKADPSQAYVGQQIDYTLRLYFAVNLADGQLGDPAVEGAEIRRVGQDANYQTTRGSRRFNVVERHYAIFPQHAGGLDIQPPTFQGTAVDPNDAGSFFGAGDPVNAVAEKVHVDVKGRPAGATDGAWIPARSLKLSIEGLPADGKATVGQPVTLTMHLDAVGMPFEALPALSLPTLDGADVYPDKPVTGGASSGPWITGRRQQSFAVVPTRAGTLHIPETTLHWWNVVTDKPEVATLPARDIVVAPGSGASAATPTAAAPQPAATTPTQEASAPASSSDTTAPGYWRWAFFAVAALWVLTLLAWWLRRGRRQTTVKDATVVRVEPVREGPAREAFRKAVASGDALAMEQALVAWARTIRPSIRSVGTLSAALRDGAQREAIAALQKARFAGGELRGDVLGDAFAKGFDWLPPVGGGPDEPLPPLYPR